MSETIIKEFKGKYHYGELQYCSHKITFGISIQHLTCKGMGWLLKFCFGPWRFWISLRQEEKGESIIIPRRKW